MWKCLGGLIVTMGILGGVTVAANEVEDGHGKIVQYGTMHEAIGQQQHQGRVSLNDLAKRPHFFGVGALEELTGEATIYDGKVTVTNVSARGRLIPGDTVSRDVQATLLVGACVPSWSDHKVLNNVEADNFDKHIAQVASQQGIDISEPFVFTIEGEFADLRLHVIHGACPLHARLKKIELPAEKRPFEAEFEKVRGTIVGVYAKDRVGQITHPGTATHAHLLFTDSESGKLATGHLEHAGLLKNSIVRLPK